MGQYLSAPITDKETLSGKTEHVHYGISSHQGWRKTQEDSHIALAMSSESYLFGVFDGHGGAEVAKFCSTHIPDELGKLDGFQKGEFEDSLVEVFHKMDELMRSDSGKGELKQLRIEGRGGEGPDAVDDTLNILRRVMEVQRAEDAGATEGEATTRREGTKNDDEIQAGCTAVVALLHRDRLFVANAGDSRAVMSRGKKALPLSHDHKPAHVTERERIVAAGGFLSEIGGVCRVNGNLNLSRAIGDLRYKMNTELEPDAQIITAQPDVHHVTLSVEDHFLVLACDGIWDVMDNQQVVDFVHEGLDKGQSPTEIASDLLNACLSNDPRASRGIGCDNMTCCIVLFEKSILDNSSGNEGATEA